MSEDYLRRLVKVVAEVVAFALAVVLLQLFINRVGFASVWPLLLGLLLVLIVAIAAMRK